MGIISLSGQDDHEEEFRWNGRGEGKARTYLTGGAPEESGEELQ